MPMCYLVQRVMVRPLGRRSRQKSGKRGRKPSSARSQVVDGAAGDVVEANIIVSGVGLVGAVECRTG